MPAPEASLDFLVADLFQHNAEAQENYRGRIALPPRVAALQWTAVAAELQDRLSRFVLFHGAASAEGQRCTRCPPGKLASPVGIFVDLLLDATPLWPQEEPSMLSFATTLAPLFTRQESVSTRRRRSGRGPAGVSYIRCVFNVYELSAKATEAKAATSASCSGPPRTAPADEEGGDARASGELLRSLDVRIDDRRHRLPQVRGGATLESVREELSRRVQAPLTLLHDAATKAALLPCEIVSDYPVAVWARVATKTSRQQAGRKRRRQQRDLIAVEAAQSVSSGRITVASQQQQRDPAMMIDIQDTPSYTTSTSGVGDLFQAPWGLGAVGDGEGATGGAVAPSDDGGRSSSGDGRLAALHMSPGDRGVHGPGGGHGSAGAIFAGNGDDTQGWLDASALAQSVAKQWPEFLRRLTEDSEVEVDDDDDDNEEEEEGPSVDHDVEDVDAKDEANRDERDSDDDEGDSGFFDALPGILPEDSAREQLDSCSSWDGASPTVVARDGLVMPAFDEENADVVDF